MQARIFLTLHKWKHYCIYLIFSIFLGNVLTVEANSCSQAHADWVTSPKTVAMQVPTDEVEPKTRGGGIGGTGAPMPSSITQEAIRVRGLETNQSRITNEKSLTPVAKSLENALSSTVVVVGKAETFPELCVSGVAIQFTEKTPVVAEGGRAHLSDIEDGALLKVSGHLINGQLQPTEIELLNTSTTTPMVLISDAVEQLYITLDATAKIENSALLAYGLVIETDGGMASSTETFISNTIVHLQKAQHRKTTWKLVDWLQPKPVTQ